MKKVLLLVGLLFVQGLALAATTFELGRDYYYEKNYERAKYYFIKETKKNPSNYQAYYFLGLSYKNLKDNSNAVVALKKVLELAPAYDLTYRYAQSELRNIENPEQVKKEYAQDRAAKKEENLKDNYYDYMLLGQKCYTWESFPITVYVEPYEHSAWVRRSFLNWEKASKNFVTFEFVDDPTLARIVVATTKKGIPSANGGQLLGVAKWRYMPNGHLHSAKITVLKRRPEDNSKYSKEHFVSVLQHEIGHSLGLGHSSSCDDIMGTHCSYNEIEERAISERDIKTLKLLYGAAN